MEWPAVQSLSDEEAQAQSGTSVAVPAAEAPAACAAAPAAEVLAAAKAEQEKTRKPALKKRPAAAAAAPAEKKLKTDEAVGTPVGEEAIVEQDQEEDEDAPVLRKPAAAPKSAAAPKAKASCKRPAASGNTIIKAVKYWYYKDRKIGIKVNGREQMTVCTLERWLQEFLHSHARFHPPEVKQREGITDEALTNIAEKPSVSISEYFVSCK